MEFAAMFANAIEVRVMRDADEVADTGTRETGSLHEASGLGDLGPRVLFSFSFSYASACGGVDARLIPQHQHPSGINRDRNG
jgi:hypothetical protein